MNADVKPDESTPIIYRRELQVIDASHHLSVYVDDLSVENISDQAQLTFLHVVRLYFVVSDFKGDPLSQAFYLCPRNV